MIDAFRAAIPASDCEFRETQALMADIHGAHPKA
jgi:hypothetical protein